MLSSCVFKTSEQKYDHIQIDWMEFPENTFMWRLLIRASKDYVDSQCK